MPVTPRRARSDARENRERLLEVAARAFAEEGLDAAPVSIAKQAGVGVGVGKLYRHLPTREALIDAAYQHELTCVCDQAAELPVRHTAAAATRAWMGLVLIARQAGHRGGSPGVPGYRSAIDHRVTTIDPGGCAPARSQHSVNVIAEHHKWSPRFRPRNMRHRRQADSNLCRHCDRPEAAVGAVSW